MDTIDSIHELPGVFTGSSDVEYHGKTYEKVVDWTGSFNEYLRFLKSKPSAANWKHNGEKFNAFLYEDTKSRIEFCGGTPDELITPTTNFGPYRKALRKIQSEKLWKEVCFSFGQITQRRRARSQYDGEFDWDKRWDAEPYHQRTPRPLISRIIKLNVETGFSCGVSSATIDDYGGFACAIVTLFERNGVLVGLNVWDSTAGICEGKGNTGSLARICYQVKRPDEYLPPGQLLKALSSNWYRRASFSLLAANAEFLGYPAENSLGRPVTFGKVWERKDNSIHIYSVPDYTKQYEIIKELSKLLTSETETKEKAV